MDEHDEKGGEFSIADARRNLPSLVRQAEKGAAVRLTRRGKPVAVLVSGAEYRRLSGRGDLWQAICAFREAHELEGMDAALDKLRDDRPPRKVAEL